MHRYNSKLPSTNRMIIKNHQIYLYIFLLLRIGKICCHVLNIYCHGNIDYNLLHEILDGCVLKNCSNFNLKVITKAIYVYIIRSCTICTICIIFVYHLHLIVLWKYNIIESSLIGT